MAKRTPKRPRHAGRGPKAAPRPRKAAAKKARPRRAATRAKAATSTKPAPKARSTAKRPAAKRAVTKLPARKRPATTPAAKRAVAAGPAPKPPRGAKSSAKPAPTRKTARKRPAPSTTRVASRTTASSPRVATPKTAAARARKPQGPPRTSPAAAPRREPKSQPGRPRFEVALPLEPLAVVPVEDANGLPANTTPSSLSADVRRPARTRASRNGTEAGDDAGSVLTAGDVDANWELAYSSGDEAPGGDNPTPDQDDADAIGRALGVEYDDSEELQGAEKIAERDRHRWELDPASSDDYKARGR